MQSSVRAGQQKLEMTHRFWRMHFQESFTWGDPKAIYWSEPTGAHAQRTNCGMARLRDSLCGIGIVKPSMPKSCEVIEVRNSADVVGYLCSKTNSTQCSDCGAELCESHGNLWWMPLDLHSSLELREPDNINDRGEIAGRGLPVGCDDVDMCGHAFLLIPCASGQGCEGNDGISARTGSPPITTNTTTLTQRRRMTKAFVAQLRARLAQRYHIRGLGASPRD
jgi:hypothetical protein